jgi:lysozyme
MAREINQAGLEIIKTSEGLRLRAYRDQRGILTIGYGHTGDVAEGSFITEDHALELLQHDIEEAEQIIESLVKTTITDNEYSALVSLVYNIGGLNFKNSTMLRLLNQRDFVGASLEFAKWDHIKIAGVEIESPGIAARRKAEAALFNS